MQVDEDPLDGAVPSSHRVPSGDAAAAARIMIEFCNTRGLEETGPIEGDGACLFRAAAVQLSMADSQHAQLTHLDVRQACVEWVIDEYGRSETDTLQQIGYRDWADWRAQMSQPQHYGDELCVEAIAAVYRVRVQLVFILNAVSPCSIRVVGDDDDELPTIYLGCVGDHHFHSLRPIQRLSDPPKVRRKRAKSKK